MFIKPVKQPSYVKDLFDIVPTKYALPQLYNTWLDDAFDEMELFGFSLRSPFQLLSKPIPTRLTAKELASKVGQTVEIVGYLVHVKRVSTMKTKQAMAFGTFIDLDGHWIDTVHFPASAKAYPFNGPGCYHIKGKVIEEFDYMALDVIEMHRLDILNRDTVDLVETEVVA